MAEARNEELELGVQVARVSSENCMEYSGLLVADPGVATEMSCYSEEQRKDPDLCMLYNYLEKEELPEDDKVARKLVAQALHFVVVDGILYFVDPKGGGRKRVAVPDHLREGFYVRAMVVYWLGTFLEPNCIKL